MLTHYFSCPYCWKEISIMIDTSVGKQQYIEDCENCCNAIEFTMQIEQKQIIHFSAEKAY